MKANFIESSSLLQLRYFMYNCMSRRLLIYVVILEGGHCNAFNPTMTGTRKFEWDIEMKLRIPFWEGGNLSVADFDVKLPVKPVEQRNGIHCNMPDIVFQWA